MVVDHHDAAVLRERAQHVVGHVARMVRDRAARGVRRDHRRLRDRQHVVERLVGDVRDVHHHPQRVQLADDVLAERREAVVRRLVGGRVGPVVVLEMRQRQVADAERRVLPELPQIVVDHVAALHAHQRGDLVLRRGAADVGGGGRQHQIVRVRLHGLVHRVDERGRGFHRGHPGDVGGHPDRKEQAVEPALAHARDIDVAVLLADADVEGLVEKEALRRVVVRVDHDRAVVQLFRTGRDTVGRGRLGEHDRRQRENGRGKNRAHEHVSHARNLTARLSRSAFAF